MSDLDIAKFLTGQANAFTPVDVGSRTEGTSMRHGVAVSDAESGEVRIVLDGDYALDGNEDDWDGSSAIDADSYDEDNILVADTQEYIEAGQRVSVVFDRGSMKAIALTPESTGAAAAAQAAAAAAIAADDAARVATDYLDFSAESGLTIGASSLDRSVNINAGGMDVKDGDDVLGHYGSYIGLGGGNGNDGFLLTVDYPTEADGYGYGKWLGITRSVQYAGNGKWNIYMDMSADLYANYFKPGAVVGEAFPSSDANRFYSYGFYEPSTGMYLPPMELELYTTEADHRISRRGGFQYDSSTGFAVWYDDLDNEAGSFGDVVGAEHALPAYMKVNGSVEASLNVYAEGFYGKFIGDGSGMRNVPGTVSATMLSWESGATSTGYTSGTDYRIRFSTSSNESVATVDSGIATIQEDGLYLIIAELMMYAGTAAATRFTHRLWTQASADGAYGIAGIDVCAQSAQTYGLAGAGSPVSVPLFWLARFRKNETIGFSAATSVTSSGTGQNTGNTHAIIVKIDSSVDSGGMEYYSGPYSVTPAASVAQTLFTAQKAMSGDVSVGRIPYSEIDNDSGGRTATIG